MAVAAVAAAFSVSTFPASVAVPPPAMPVQVAEASVQPVGTVSVMVVTVPAAVSVTTDELCGLARLVSRLAPPKPLLPVKSNDPVLPTDCLRTCSVGRLPLMMAQVMMALGLTLVAATVTS